MRLGKFIAQQLGISRAMAGREIRSSRVLVDNKIIKDASFQLQPEHEVKYNDTPLIQHRGWRYFMLNKPQGYVCSTDDPDHPTIIYFLDVPMANKLHAAGRLDIDTTGLVLITDDGKWSHRITSPRHHCEKTYRVTLAYPLDERTVEQFAKGIQLHNEKELTKPARLEVLTPTDVRLTIVEGRYHQVKRMFAATGNHVVALHRERIGNIILDSALAPGEYRPLTEEEISHISL
ncbi:16S rRNA pseudouridine(516) synthase RsuA [Enterobacteriaceae bacterium ESL0689]|nr:16S rRNA pseudouridine(516) synthase RsuA [Enterobacteriaceae bacterium ESL0689]